MSEKTFLIVGGAGYIGQVLVSKLLQAELKVIVYDNVPQPVQLKGAIWVVGDILDSHNLSKYIKKADVIIWLAAVVSPKTCAEMDYSYVRDVNVNSLKNISRARADIPLIFFSTNIGYGARTKTAIYDEMSPLEPISLYGQTKIEAETLLIADGNFVILRPASAYGVSPGMKSHLLINYFVREAVINGHVDLVEADAVRNFIHVSDLALSVIHVAE